VHISLVWRPPERPDVHIPRVWRPPERLDVHMSRVWRPPERPDVHISRVWRPPERLDVHISWVWRPPERPDVHISRVCQNWPIWDPKNRHREDLQKRTSSTGAQTPIFIVFEATSSEDSETARLGFPYFQSKKRTVPKYPEIPYMKTSYFAYKIQKIRLPSRVSSFRARTRLKTDMSGASFRVLFWPRGIARVRIPIILQKTQKSSAILAISYQFRTEKYKIFQICLTEVGARARKTLWIPGCQERCRKIL